MCRLFLLWLVISVFLPSLRNDQALINQVARLGRKIDQLRADVCNGCKISNKSNRQIEFLLLHMTAGKAYKLVNEFSHNSDPTITIEHKDKSESKDAIKILLNIVKESDLKHFEILEKNY
ncbi:MAG: hypothetical protein WCJ49_01760 [Deltaproteobacteria bacterium]